MGSTDVDGKSGRSLSRDLGRRRGTDVEAILDTLPGVPTSEYDPALDGIVSPDGGREGGARAPRDAAEADRPGGDAE